jgi:hypothetical protein
MTTLTDRLAALPKMPDKAATDELLRIFAHNKVIVAGAIADFTQRERDALSARNALLCEALREAVEYSLKGQYRVTRYGHVEYLKAILAACEQEQRK